MQIIGHTTYYTKCHKSCEVNTRIEVEINSPVFKIYKKVYLILNVEEENEAPLEAAEALENSSEIFCVFTIVFLK